MHRILVTNFEEHIKRKKKMYIQTKLLALGNRFIQKWQFSYHRKVAAQDIYHYIHYQTDKRKSLILFG